MIEPFFFFGWTGVCRCVRGAREGQEQVHYLYCWRCDAGQSGGVANKTRVCVCGGALLRKVARRGLGFMEVSTVVRAV